VRFGLKRLAGLWERPREVPVAPGFAEVNARFLAPAELPAPPQEAGVADAALLATLLGLATRTDDAEPLARAVVQRFGGFAGVLAAAPRDLFAVRGFGRHSVANIKLVHEAAQRLLRAEVAHAPVLQDWAKLFAYLHAVVARERVEQFRILFLDAAGRLLADEAQARGTVNHTPVYPREVARRALELGAAGLILVHNHPSGDPTPSEADVQMTWSVCEAVEVFGMRVVDHVIIGNGRFTSFRREGLVGE
jgi:DNA repair protein RadC